jgi:hypothetical protein
MAKKRVVDTLPASRRVAAAAGKGLKVTDTNAALVSQGQWLGVDVGSAREKVFNFCLIESDGNGQVDVLFEAGKARGEFPRSDAANFLKLKQATWLSKAAEAGSVQILDESALVKTWNAARDLGSGCLGVCIDAPCGFALPGFDRRNTETQRVGSFPKPPLADFLKEMTILRVFLCGGFLHGSRQVFTDCLLGLAVGRSVVSRATRKEPSARSTR